MESGLLDALSELLHPLGGLFCHQQAARSLALGALPPPLCVRCTGLYLAGLLCGVLALLLRRLPARSAWASWGLGALLVVPTLADVLLGEYVTTGLPAAGRMVVACLGGAGVAWVMLRALQWRGALQYGSPAPLLPAAWVPLLAAAAALVLVLHAQAAASLSPQLGAGLARIGIGALSLLGALAFVAACVALGLAVLLPWRVRRRKPIWSLSVGLVSLAVLVALATMPSYWRNPFYWVRLLGRWLRS